MHTNHNFQLIDLTADDFNHHRRHRPWTSPNDMIQPWTTERCKIAKTKHQHRLYAGAMVAEGETDFSGRDKRVAERLAEVEEALEQLEQAQDGEVVQVSEIPRPEIPEEQPLDVSLPNMVELALNTPTHSTPAQKPEPEVKEEPVSMASVPTSLPTAHITRWATLPSTLTNREQTPDEPHSETLFASPLSDITNTCDDTTTRSVTLGSRTPTPLPILSPSGSPPYKVRRSSRLHKKAE